MSATEERFKVDRTSSNRAGVTLMNNQVGHTVADVMRKHDNVTVEELPSMIRVDGTGQFDFDYEEIAEALGWADFGNDDFEEIMSTHYGRMVVLDDRVIMFANPEDAAEYIDFDLKPVGSAEREELHVREGRREVLRPGHATPTSGTRARRTGSRARGVREGLDRVLPRLPGPRPGRDALVDRGVPEVLRRSDFEKDMFEDGHVDVADLPAHVPEGVVHERASTRPSRTPRWRPGTRTS